MLSGIFQKRKKIQELRSPALQDIKNLPPTCLYNGPKSVYKAISCQKELHSADFRQEDITDPQLVALAETLVEMPMISTLDLRDNRITDDGAKALLEVLRLQIIAAKTPLKTDPKTRMPIIPSVPEYTRYVTQVNMKGNEISASVLQELAQYTEILKREDKRVEIRAALAQIDRNSTGGIDEEEFKAVLKLLTGTEPNKKEVKLLVQQHTSQLSGDSSVQKSVVSLENLLLAKCSSSPSKKAACPPWEALVQVRHATLGQSYPSQLAKAKSEYTAEPTHASEGRMTAAATHCSQSQQIPQKTDAPTIQVSSNSSSSSSSSASQYGTQRISVVGSNVPNANAKLAMAMPPPPPPLQIPSTPSQQQQQQQQSPVSSSSGSSDHGGGSAYVKLKADFKPPASPPPPLPLPQTLASPSSSSPESRGSVSISGHDFSFTSRESQENTIAEQYPPPKPQTTSAITLVEIPATATAIPARAPNSPDRMSVYSSSSSFSQYIDTLDTPRQSAATPSTAVASSQVAAQRNTAEDLEKKKLTPQSSVANSVISESPRWRDEDIFTDDEGDEEELESNGHIIGGTGNDVSLNDNELDDEPTTKSGGSGQDVNASTGSVSSSSRWSLNSGPMSKSSGHHRRMDSGTFASEIVELSDGEDGPVTQPLSSAAADNVDNASSSSKDKDLSSLIYRATGDESTDSTAARRQNVSALPLSLGENDDGSAEPQSNNDDDNVSEERVDSIVVDIMKDGKPRSVAKVVHTEFKRGMPLKEFPTEIPFRNLIALILSENGLSNLELLKECRFPCTTILDLSKNRITKLADGDFSAFPKLQVLNLAHNRLRSIQGLGKVFDLKALNVDHNAMKTVKNIEHLVQLQVLKVSNNFISNSSALRLLSLNKMLTHLDLDGNPVVETDERQKRKNIVYILNLMPMLLSLGSVPCASLHSKERKKALALQGLGAADKTTAGGVAAHGKALLDTNDMFPDFQALWITQACEILQFFQDVEVQPKYRSSNYNNGGDDDDQWGGGGSNDDDSDARHPRKPLNKKQQLQKDELRSRAVGYRSREKAIPSPPKVKTSVYSFGPPLPPPTAKKPPKKKAPPADPKVVKMQQRRASELSAPKHQPVDKSLLSQEQKRKSRPTFDVNMSVAERLLLAQEKAQRRSSTNGSKGLGSSGLQRTKSIAVTTSGSNDGCNLQTPPAQSNNLQSAPSPTARSPGRGNQEVVAFRIEPLRSNGSPTKSSSVEKTTSQQQQQVATESTSPRFQPSPNAKPLVFSVSPLPSKPDSRTITGSGTINKESSFLQDLAVTDFLNHAEEEFSTALTALNVLLTMSEKELSDTNKLKEYRCSLEALDILDERESHALYAKIRDHKEHHVRGTECTQAFERLGIVKKSIRQLLEKLEIHAPGSSAIRAFCRSLRTNDLRAILNTSDADPREEEKQRLEKKQDEDLMVEDSVEVRENSPPALEELTTLSPSLTTRLIASSADTEDEVPEKSPPLSNESQVKTKTVAKSVEAPTIAYESTDKLPGNDEEEDEFDFLSNDKSVFDDDPVASDDAFSATPALDLLDADEQNTVSPSHSPVPVSAYSPKTATYFVTTDITEDIQSHEDTSDLFSDGDAVGTTIGSAEHIGSELHEDTSDLFSEDDTVDATIGGADPAEPELPEDTPANNFDSSETAALGDEADDAWLTTESTALDELNTDTGGEELAAADATDDIFQEEEEQQEHTEEPDVVDAYDTEATPAISGDLVDDDFGSYQDEEIFAEAENQEFDTATVGADAEIPADQPEEENPLSEAEDADDEEAEMFGDWEKGFDPNTNHYFWFNHETGESAWTPPEGWPFEVDTPFEPDGVYCVEGEAEEAQAEGEDGYATDEAATAEADAGYEDELAHETIEGDQDAEWECEGEHSAIESSQKPLSEFDDDLFSDQDLPTF